MPTVNDARAIARSLKGRGKMHSRAIALVFRKYCKEKGIAQLTQVGMRYLLYSAGVPHCKVSETNYFIF